ncbi:16S rRNA (uracil(1498)-N(3))-methyltransferase [Zavarzinia compransoris]|uniref:Ribosomal RNA small subunit methyltransferase E n=1 Tax=Zavarzinia compransoris TaxID=1264899 RepID=A0A317DYM8_9PROT|nr:16S rRNA (uracil(1498)-N(3))-methyltransferase [Zavarzinia compransoris]PWR19858.1 16S rRNA (uracil(1498)-N(3))-methyltransferase [Zavarzinia compransoris]TDP45031.1 16S rRNA (uracil1498-N3)-methyltransferase [Zavarzinia compransoris]
MSERPRHRLFVDADLAPGIAVALDDGQAHYLTHVLRLGDGDKVAVFNGRDGEWCAGLARQGKKGAALIPAESLAPQPVEADTSLVFAPIRGAKVEFVAEKATELGATRLIPAVTRRTVIDRANAQRMRANAVEAAEQCGRLAVPAIEDIRKLDQILGAWNPAVPLFFCDEAGDAPHLLDAARDIGAGPAALLIGPEGGFDPVERVLLRRLPFVRPSGLGPRILRAETAAIAGLALLQAARER